MMVGTNMEQLIEMLGGVGDAADFLGISGADEQVVRSEIKRRLGVHGIVQDRDGVFVTIQVGNN